MGMKKSTKVARNQRFIFPPPQKTRTVPQWILFSERILWLVWPFPKWIFLGSAMLQLCRG